VKSNFLTHHSSLIELQDYCLIIFLELPNTPFGLTAGFFGEDPQEIAWFLENIQAGTTYINRPSGATTGAWPGVQAFGGWKGSGSSGKGIGALYTLPLYMREQSRTIIG
jgi:1-pyrroline-5-carboxylate dehydrogenase